MHDFESSKEISSVDKERSSEEGSDEIEGNKIHIFHLSNSRYKGCKSSHDWHKSRVNNSFSSVFVKEVLGFVHVFLFDEFWVFLSDFWTEEFSDFVVHTISEHGSDENYEPDEVDIEVVCWVVRKGSSCEK